MKTKQFFLTLIITLFTFTIQAQIIGPGSLKCGNKATYSIPNLGQCPQCYDWDVTGDISILSSDMNNSVTVLAGNNSGSGMVKVTYFNEEGCHETSLHMRIQCLSSGCCLPKLDGYLKCNAWSGASGNVFVDFLGNNCDTTSVKSIHWSLSGAKFSTGPLAGLSSGTTFGAGAPGEISSNCKNVPVKATIQYNNGCPDVFLFKTILTNTISPYLTKIYPNPAKSKINIELGEFEKMNNVEIKFFDLTTGKEVYSKKVSKNELRKTITIDYLAKNKSLKVVILDNGKIIKKSTVLIE